MKVKYVSLSKYKSMHSSMMGNRLYERPPWVGMEYQLKQMHVIGVSDGTKFANELERMKHEYYNPPLPREIVIHDVNGSTSYRVR